MLYLDSLLMTLMRAPFSSFSLWLSDFSSVNTCGGWQRERCVRACNDHLLYQASLASEQGLPCEELSPPLHPGMKFPWIFLFIELVMLMFGEPKAPHFLSQNI
jgi:hypothetical protein